MKSLRAVRGRAVSFRAQFIASVSDLGFSGMVGRAQSPLRRGAPSIRFIYYHPWSVCLCVTVCEAKSASGLRLRSGLWCRAGGARPHRPRQAS